MKVMIAGAGGQIGAFLIPTLQGPSVDIATISRTQSLKLNDSSLTKNYFVHDYELNDVFRAIDEFEPNVFVNLASLSSVLECEKYPSISKRINQEFPLAILESIKLGLFKDLTFIQASSSEMYACSSHKVISEHTNTCAKSVYGLQKSEVHNAIRRLRENDKVKALSVILFNNESWRRDSRFASKRIVRDLIEVKLGARNVFEIGNLDILRDWNHPLDTSEALKLIINSNSLSDYVVGSGKLHSIREFIEEVAKCLNLDLSKVPFITNSNLVRTNDNHAIRANSSKIREELGWIPQYDFPKIVHEIVKHELASISVDLEFPETKGTFDSP
jgi:GDPmannose 4,6-dehydratase